ncbi:putative transposase [Bradyrhizobium diazoefficiens]
MSTPDRRGMLDRADQALSIRRQCMLLGIARSGVYRPPQPANDNDLALMQRIDELFTAWPFLGSRRMTAMLKAEGLQVNRKRVQRLMRKMGIAALGPKPNTTKPAPGHKIYPYLLRNMTIDRPNQVWAADITYLPIGRGFLYLVAIIDWASRAVLAWRLSNTMDVSFCVAALEEALATYGTPEIFNTDQGSQFTSVAFTGALVGAGIKISMDGRGRWMDNVFIERLWRSLKHEDIYLKGYADGREAKAGIASWIAFYNDRRLHQSLGYRTPMAVWRERMQAAQAVDMVDNADALTTCPCPTIDTVSGSSHSARSNSSRQSLWLRDRKGSGAIRFQLTNRFNRSRSAGPFQFCSAKTSRSRSDFSSSSISQAKSSTPRNGRRMTCPGSSPG